MENPFANCSRFSVRSLFAGLLLLGTSSCGRNDGGGPRVPPAEAILERQIEQVQAMLAATRNRSVVDFNQIVVTVNEKLVAELLDAATPYERVVDDKYRIRLASAAVSFRGGLALVRLDGRASLADGNDESISADVRVYGALEIVGLDPKSGVLRAKVNVLGLEVPQIAGVSLPGPVRGFVGDLAKEPVDKFSGLLSDLEIPIAIEQQVDIPGIGPDEEVTIEPVTLPLRVIVQDVKVMVGKLWIVIGVEVKPGEKEAPVVYPQLPAGEVLVYTERWHTGKTKLKPPPASGDSAFAAVEAPRRPTITDPAALFVTSADSASPRLKELRARYDVLVDSVMTVTAKDTLLYQIAADSGDVDIIVRPEFVEGLLREVSTRYLDRIDLDLVLEENAKEGDEVKVKTPLGKVDAGRWDVHVTIHRVRGTLTAKPPDLNVAGDNRLRVSIPVLFREGYATATIRFSWDAEGVAEAACHDFRTSVEVDGAGIPKEYTLTGDLVLTTDGDRIVARPEFPVQKARFSAKPSDKTWGKVRSTLSELDDFEKCGIGLEVMSPDKVVELLTKLVTKGFKVKLPTKVVPTLDIPASISESVEVEDVRVDVAVKPLDLRITPRALWYSARVAARPASALGD